MKPAGLEYLRANGVRVVLLERTNAVAKEIASNNLLGVDEKQVARTARLHELDFGQLEEACSR